MPPPGPGSQSWRLNHVALTVSDRERSARFYATHFGLTARVLDDEHLLILAAPDGALLALSEGTPPDLPRANHFGFQAADAAQVRAARDRLREAGVPEREWQDDGAFTRVQVADPDGYLVDLFTHPPVGAG